MSPRTGRSAAKQSPPGYRSPGAALVIHRPRCARKADQDTSGLGFRTPKSSRRSIQASRARPHLDDRAQRWRRTLWPRIDCVKRAWLRANTLDADAKSTREQTQLSDIEEAQYRGVQAGACRASGSAVQSHADTGAQPSPASYRGLVCPPSFLNGSADQRRLPIMPRLNIAGTPHSLEYSAHRIGESHLPAPTLRARARQKCSPAKFMGFAAQGIQGLG